MIFVLTAVALPVLGIGALIFELWYSNNYKSVVQVLERNGGESRFVLLTDIAGFGDPAWYVYQIRSGGAQSDAIRKAHNAEGALFWNYSETGDQTSDPEIEIVDKRYLIFSRGGLYHSLYDLATHRVLINEESPWAAFIMSGGNYEGEAGPRNFRKWKVKALHTPIRRIIKKSTPSG